MTTPEDPQIAHSFGRVEAKLDRISDNQNAHAAKLAEHGVRIGRVEVDVDRIQTDLNADSRDKSKSISTGRQLFWVAVAGAAASGIVGFLVQLITRH